MTTPDLLTLRSSRSTMLVAALLVLLAAGRSAGAQERFPTLDDFLARGIKLDKGQLADLEKGKVVGKVLPTSDERDVAVFGAVRIDVSRADVAAYVRQRMVDYVTDYRQRGNAQWWTTTISEASIPVTRWPHY